MSEPTVSISRFLGAIQTRLNGCVVGYSCVIGDPDFTLPYSWGEARTATDGLLSFEPSTEFGIASVSKLLTALAAVRLLDGTQDGLEPPNHLGLTLDDPMFLALPKGWDILDPAVREITFRELLTHTSGLAPEGPGEPQQDYASLEAYITQQSVPLVPISGRPAYSNTGFALFRLLLPMLNGLNDNPGASADERAEVYALEYAAVIQNLVFDPVAAGGADTATPADGNYAFGYWYPWSSPGSDWSTWKYPGQTLPGQGEPLWAGSGCWWVSIDQMAKVLDSLNRIDGKIISATQWNHLQGNDLPLGVVGFGGPRGFQGLGLGLDSVVDSATGYRWLEKNGSASTPQGTMTSSVAFFGSPTPGPRAGRPTGVPATSKGPLYAALFINSDIFQGPGVSAGAGAQNDWYYCTVCQSLFFAGHGDGQCPVGGGHTGGGEYALTTGQPAGAPPEGQSGWKWCSKCQALCYEPGTSAYPSICPLDKGQHECPYPPYFLTEIGSATAPGIATMDLQADWRWCRKCGVLFFSGINLGHCAAGHEHDPSGSGNYSVLEYPFDADGVLLGAFYEAIVP